MSNKTRIAATIAAVLACSCGGGGIYDTPDDGNNLVSPIDTTGTRLPATIATPGDAAKAAAALLDFISMNGGLSIQGKATTTTPCDSGSRTYTTDDSTPNTSDGRTVYDDCAEIVTSNGQEVFRQVTDGVLVADCHDSFASDTCQDQTDQVGEGATPLTFEIITPSSDQRSMALGATRVTTTGDKAADGQVQYDNLLSHKSATIVYDHVLMFGSAGSGNRTAIVGGSYALNQMAQSTANCILGRVTVSTPDAQLSIDGNDNIVGGHLHFVSSNGNTGDVYFQPDGSVLASANSGAQQSFPAAQLRGYCSIQ